MSDKTKTLSQEIRKFSERISSQSDKESKRIVAHASRTFTHAAKTAEKVDPELIKSMYDAGGSTYRAVATALNNETVRPMVERFVKNIINDFATRSNELANIIDAASKERDVIDAVDKVVGTMYRFRSALKRQNDAFESLHKGALREVAEEAVQGEQTEKPFKVKLTTVTTRPVSREEFEAGPARPMAPAPSPVPSPAASQEIEAALERFKAALAEAYSQMDGLPCKIDVKINATPNE